MRCSRLVGHIVFVAVCFLSLSSARAAERWIPIATHSVDLSSGEADVDIASLQRPLAEIRAVRLVASREGITLTKVTLFFADGHFHVEDRRINLLQGERTRPIGASDRSRRLERISLQFDKRTPATSAIIEVWGLVVDQPTTPAVAAAPKASVAAPRFSGSASDNVCSQKSICTPVQVFFGTDRTRSDTTERVGFGTDRAGQLQLGRAIVTVPRTTRKRGQVSRPQWWERWFFGVSAQGDPSKHFTIPRGGIVLYRSPGEALDAVRQHMKNAGDFRDHAFVFIHGYNVSFDDAAYRTAQIAYDLGRDDEPFGTAFLYSWPSAADTKYYVYDSDSARFAASHLRTFLEQVVGKSGATNIHLIAHSMGNLALLMALEDFVKTPGSAPALSQLILAAPDVDAGDFERLSKLILPLVKSITLYASSKDLAMAASRVVHKGKPRAGDVPLPGGPVVLPSVDTIDISSISTEIFSMGHAEYANRKELLNDMVQILRSGTRPPHERNNNYQKVPKQELVFWRYPE